jgi:hypothetical protein
MSAETTYEIIQISKIMDDYKISQNCRSISMEKAKKLRCEAYSEVYRCSGLERYISARDALRDPALLRLAELGRLATETAVNGTLINNAELAVDAGRIASIALDRLGAPQAYQKYGNRFRGLLIDAYQNGFPRYPDEKELTQEQLYEMFAWIFILASPDRHDEFYSDIQKNAITLFRRLEIYPKLTPIDRLVWSGANDDARSIRAQFGIKQFPYTD